MGNPETPKNDPSIQHFSHEHQLQLLNIKYQPTLNFVSCAACKLKPSEWVYACKPCDFILDIPCSQLPKFIKHHADPNHTFTLLTKPAYPCGEFRCDGCWNNGNGFNYHCSTCGQDIHTTCATMPLSLTHHNHPHPLNLVLSPPYPIKGFTCDVCHRQGFNHWLYRCNACGFDVHLYCATSKPPALPSAPPVSQYQHRSLELPEPQSPRPRPSKLSTIASITKRAMKVGWELSQHADLLSAIVGDDSIGVGGIFLADGASSLVQNLSLGDSEC